MEIKFIQETHQYFDEQNRELIAVTKLLTEQGLAPDYSQAEDIAALAIGRETGTLTHSVLEAYARGEEAEGPEVEQLRTFIAEQFDDPTAVILNPERIIWTADYAGRIDLVIRSDEKNIIVDYKTGKVNETAVRWQVSLYAQAWEQITGSKASELWCLEYIGTDDFRAFRIDRIGESQIDAMLEAHRAGKIYSQCSLPAIATERAIEIMRQMTSLKSRLAELEDAYEQSKAGILQAMLDNDIKSADFGAYRITAVSATTRTTVDSKKLKAEFPNIYSECSKTTEVKPNLKITIREVD